MQCYRCQCYGHIGHRCFSQPRCATCAGSNDEEQCPCPETRKCVLCNDDSHTARSAKCPQRKRAQAEAAEEIGRLPTRYTATPKEKLIRKAEQEKSDAYTTWRDAAPGPGRQSPPIASILTRPLLQAPRDLTKTTVETTEPASSQGREITIQRNTTIVISPKKGSLTGRKITPINQTDPEMQKELEEILKQKKQLATAETRLRQRLFPDSQNTRGQLNSSGDGSNISPLELRPPQKLGKRRADGQDNHGPAKKTRSERADAVKKTTDPTLPNIPTTPLFIEPATLSTLE